MNPDDETRRWHSIGRPLPGVELTLVDQAGTIIKGEGIGEMRISGTPGHTLAAGYYRDPEATHLTFAEDGLHTGDLARRDADGFLYFVDRVKDMIKSAGENVSAGEIERVVSEHPAIAECAAIGVPDQVLDEVILLVAVTRPGAAQDEGEIVAWCRARLSPFKVPKAVVFVEALPRTSVGKIRKGELRALGGARRHAGH
jgi:carnitine-CoA ligase